MHKQILSPQNAKVKQLFQLREKSRSRKKEQLFLIEGIQETLLALQGGYIVKEVYVCIDILSIDDFNSQFSEYLTTFSFIEISIEVYQKLAYRTSTEGAQKQIPKRENGLAEESSPFCSGK